ncbi:hypothetical protein Tco_0702779 [Tanacetum coccineum]|uniref:Uncharacterized protein n=1 Tax=Tanacetum coccineum TaxID=301880 RepID=A0ABQ4XYK7_9ASTR
MDENTVRFWLKDHQDAAEKLVRQQAEAFQLQLDTLRDDPDRWIFAIMETQTHLQHELLVSRPIMLGDAFSLAHNIEARFEEIAEKEQNIKEKADTTLTFPSEEASPVVKGPLNASEDTLLSLRSLLMRFVTSLPNFPKKIMGSQNQDNFFGHYLEDKVVLKVWRVLRQCYRRKDDPNDPRGRCPDPKVKQECFSRQHLEGNVVLKERGMIRLGSIP